MFYLSIFSIIIFLCNCSTKSNAILKKYYPRYALNIKCQAIENRDSLPSRIEAVDFSGRGCVLLAQPNDHSHFFIRAAIFIYQHSEKDGSMGVILERPTAFTMGESSPGIGVFEGNTLYMGGDNGSDTAIMLGKFDLQGTCKYIGSGIFLGGMRTAADKVRAGEAVPKDFKFFFNHAEWAPGVLEKEIASGRWDVVKMPPEEVLRQDTEGSLWYRARNTILSGKGRE
jgi:putative AlgH/UPF0301 family transcriptional regulator